MVSVLAPCLCSNSAPPLSTCESEYIYRWPEAAMKAPGGLVAAQSCWCSRSVHTSPVHSWHTQVVGLGGGMSRSCHVYTPH